MEIKVQSLAVPVVIDLLPGETKDLYFQFNLSGKVYVRIAAKGGNEACAEFWWIKWPLGSISSLGKHCTEAEFDIPGLFELSISSKLRVGGATNVVKVGVTDNAEVASKLTFEF